jgi:hypothetical protein
MLPMEVPMNDLELEKIQSYADMKEGQLDQTLNKRICRLIWAEDHFAVYLCDDFRIHVLIGNKYGKIPGEYGEINSRVSELQASSGVLLEEKTLLEEFRALLAEAIARTLQDKNANNATGILANAQNLLDLWALESARKSYLLSCLSMTLLSMMCILCLWIFRGILTVSLGQSAFDVMVGTLLGAAGAMISVYTRIGDLPIDKKSRRSTHLIDGAARIFAAMLGALLTAVCIKANVLIGFANTVSHATPLLFFICLAAGASERLVPSLISYAETKTPKSDKVVAPNQEKPPHG